MVNETKNEKIARLEEELKNSKYETFMLRLSIKLLGDMKHTIFCDYLNTSEEKLKIELENIKLRETLEQIGICPDCLHSIAIRNPTGKCDHLYYPEYKKVKQ